MSDDAKVRFGVEVTGEKEVRSLESLVDEVVAEVERPHALDVNTDSARSSLSELADMAKSALSFEAIGSLGGALSSFEELGKGARDSLRTISAQTGLFGDELEAVADRADDAFLRGVGGNVEEARKAIGTAEAQLGKFLDPEGVDAFLTRAGGIGKVFDKDVNEVLSKSRTFVAQFGLEGAEAGDLIALAMQKGGSAMDDVLDTTDEYSQLVKEAGFSAQEFVGILTTGIQAGVRDTDKLADAMKETQIRLKAGDISKTLEEINTPITAAIAGIVKAGEEGRKTSAQVMTETAKAIESAFDAGQISETMKSQLQVAVAGTPAEDIGAEMYGRVFGAPIDTDSITAQASVAGKQMADAIGNQTVFESLTKNFELIGTKVSEFAAPIIGGLGGVLDVVGQIGPAVALMIPAFAATGGVMATVGAAATAMWTAITGPVGLVVLAVGAVIGVLVLAYNTSEDFRNAVDELWQTVSNFVSELWDRFKPVLETVWGLIKEVASFIWDVVVAYFKAWWTVISEVVSVIGDLIGGMFETGKGGSFLETVLAKLGAGFDFLKRMVDGLRLGLAGIQGAFSAVINVISGVIRAFTQGSLLEGVKAAFEAFTSIGGAASEGFQKGMAAKAAELQRAASEVATVPASPAVTAAATASGTRVGSAFGSGIATSAKAAATRSMISFGDDIAKLLEKEFLEGVDLMLRHSLALADTELERIEAEFFAESQRQERAFENQRKAILTKFGQEGATKRALTAKERDALKTLLDDLDKEAGRAIAALTRGRESAIREYQDSIVADMTRRSPLRELPALVVTSEQQQLEAQIAALALQRSKLFGALMFDKSISQETYDEAVADIDGRVADLTERIQDTTGREAQKRTDALTASVETMFSGIGTAVSGVFDVANRERVQGELDTLRDEEAALELSFARRGRMSEEDARRRVQIAEEIADKEKELANETADVWGVALSTMGAVAASIRDTFKKSFDDGIEEVKKGNATLESLADDAILHIMGATVAAIASQEDAGRAFLSSMFDVLQGMVPIWSAEILGFSLATPGGVASFGATALLEWAALTSLITAAVSGARGALGFWSGGVDIDGDRSRGDSIFAMIAAGESVITRQGTASNRDLLTAINRWPHIDFASVLTSARMEDTRVFVREEARALRAEAAHELVALRQQQTAQADEALKEMKSLRSDMRQMVAALDVQTTEVRRGIPVRGKTFVRRGTIEQTFTTDRTRHNGRS